MSKERGDFLETSFSQHDPVAVNKKFKKQVSRMTGIGSLILVLYVASR